MNNNLDQFYTNPKISDNLIKVIDNYLKSAGILPNKLTWIEPSAGSGNFIDSLKGIYSKKNIKEILAYDLEPKLNSEIKRKNWFEVELNFSETNIVFGNPPFGNRAKLAIDFLNKAFKISNIVAFILPVQFERFLTQKKLDNNFKLIHSSTIEKNAFLVNDRAYDVNTVFQIWVNRDCSEWKEFKDYRQYKAPKKIHPEFKTFIHNNTKNTLKYFDKKTFEWDFALHRQGYYDYQKIITNEEELIKNRQYFFVKCIDDKCLEIVPKMDIIKISKSNTSTPGFSTENFIKEYSNTKAKMTRNKNKLLK